MSAQQVGSNRHGEQHAGEQDVVAQAAGVQQERVRRLVDHEAAGRDGEEAGRRAHERIAMIPKRQSMMSGEGGHHRDEPASDIGDQRSDPGVADKRHHNNPVHGGRDAADGDEPGNATLRPRTQADGRAASRLAHVAGEHTRRSICVVVDDFGLHPGICDAALRLGVLGRVHAIGCQVGGGSWAGWHPELRMLALGEIDLGLHLDLTERPLTIEPWPIARIVARSLLRRLDVEAARGEVRAQLDAFEDALQRGPDFVDGHQHVHQLPVVRDALLEELTRRYPSTLPWLRSTRAAHAWPGFAAQAWRDAAKARTIETLGASGLAKRARRLGFRQNGRLCGVYDFSGDEVAFLARLDGWFNGCRTGDLLMCHPSAAHDTHDGIAGARVVEFQSLAGDRFGALLRAHAIGLESMSHILGLRRAAA